jgi:hypothetical protein
MGISQIFINDIKVITNNIENCDYDCGYVLSMMNGKIESQKVSDNYDKIIIREISSSILTVIIDCKEKKIRSISFNGYIDINPKELFLMYADYREGYSIRDNMYFYFFNEDRKKGNYTISFFEPSHKQVDIHKSDENLSNILLSWG